MMSAVAMGFMEFYFSDQLAIQAFSSRLRVQQWTWILGKFLAFMLYFMWDPLLILTWHEIWNHVDFSGGYLAASSEAKGKFLF